ncbi:MAG: type 4a pilus biogenesis protein PilO [Elusimicrobiota bacterium]|jgi:type IV pilus assembly protein PilO
MAKIDLRLTKEQQQMIALSILFFGGGGFLFFRYFWIPMSLKIKETQVKIAEVQGKINRARGQAGRLTQIQAEITRLNEQAIEAEQRLPKQKDLPAVIITLSSLMRKSNVQITSFTAGRETPREYFIEVPYQVNARGMYHDIGRLFAAIALEQRIFNVRTVNYGSPDQDGKLTVSFTLFSYQYKG